MAIGKLPRVLFSAKRKPDTHESVKRHSLLEMVQLATIS